MLDRWYSPGVDKLGEGAGCELRYIGVARNQLWADLTVAAYNLVRMAKLALNPG